MLYRFGDCELDTRLYNLRRRGEAARLQPRVYRILKYFLDHRDRVISKDELCEHIWPKQFIANATLESAIRSVRRAVGDSGREQRIIQTVWGYGYRFVAEVTEHTEAIPSEAFPVANEPKSAFESSAFVGRQRELTVLQDVLAGVERGQGHIVSLVGASGIGKSRLLQAFAERLTPGRFTYVAGRCELNRSVVSYGLMRNIVRQLCALTESHDHDTIMSQVTAACRTVELADEGQVKYLCDLLGVDRQRTQLLSLKPEWIRVRTVSAVCQLLLAYSRQQPLVLAIDDIHWMDRASEACLLALVEQFANAAILVVATHVSTYQPKWTSPVATRRLLGPLTTAESLRLIRQHASSEWPETLEQTVLAKAAGQPLFLHELAQWVAAHTSDQDWLQSAELPGDVQASIRARLQRLPEHAVRRLCQAAVSGRTFTRRHVEVLGGAPIDIEASLRELEQQGWLDVDDAAGIYAFKHVLVRDVIHDHLPGDVRQALHQTMVEALADRRVEPGDDLAAVLAYHYEQAAVPEQAIQSLVVLADRAMAAGYPGSALVVLQDGLNWVDRLPLGSQLATRLDLVLRQAQALFALGQMQVALDLLASQSFGNITAGQDDVLACRYALLMSQLHRHQQTWSEVSRHAQHAADAAARCGDDVAVGRACVLLAEARYWAGAFQEGMASGQRAVRLLASSDERFQLAMACLIVGLNARALGAFSDAQRSIEQMRVVGTAMDDPHVLRFADWATGWIQATYGAWDDAIVACQRSLDQAPDQLSMALAMGWLGYAHVEKCDAAEAVGFLEQAAHYVRQLQRQRLEALFTIYWGGGLLAAGDVASARDVTQQGLHIAQAADYRYGIAWGQRTQGQVALAMQSASTAELEFRRALASFSSMRARFEVGRTHLAMATTASLESASAEMHLTEALTIFNQLQVPHYVAYTRQRQSALRRS